MSIKVTLLGTGTPAPNPERFQSATVVEIGEDLLLFDAGRGTVHQMARARMEIGQVNPVFITHHHVDHISDLFDVVITTALEGRTRSLRIFGPAGTRQIVGALIDEVYARDLRTRDPGLIGVVETEDVGPGMVCGTDRWKVSADEVLHGDFAGDPGFDWRCLGYRIEAKGRVVTISGDTVPCDGIARLARDADLLVQCCHYPESSVTDPAIEHMTRHTLPSSGQVGTIAARANVKHVVLTHISMRVDGPAMLDEMCEDVRREFEGEVTAGEDLMVLEI